jgi:uncharacterized membrane protein YedE/YeeE
MEQFLLPILGGIFIGLAAFFLLISLGKIAGVAGIIWGVMFADSNDRFWRLLFLAGLMLGALLFHQISGSPLPSGDHNTPLAILAGLIVGIGVRIGNGCTSGHGVCGISRLSMRSLVATATFMLVAVLTVVVTHVLGW